MLWRNMMEYVQANILRLFCTSIHTPREKMIERARLGDCIKTPYKSSTSKNVHRAGPYILIMAETYRVPQGLIKEILAVKGANILLTTSYHTQRDKLTERAR
jgi:hypothetical protein